MRGEKRLLERLERLRPYLPPGSELHLDDGRGNRLSLAQAGSARRHQLWIWRGRPEDWGPPATSWEEVTDLRPSGAQREISARTLASWLSGLDDTKVRLEMAYGRLIRVLIPEVGVRVLDGEPINTLAILAGAAFIARLQKSAAWLPNNFPSVTFHLRVDPDDFLALDLKIRAGNGDKAIVVDPLTSTPDAVILLRYALLLLRNPARIVAWLADVRFACEQLDMCRREFSLSSPSPLFT